MDLMKGPNEIQLFFVKILWLDDPMGLGAR